MAFCLKKGAKRIRDRYPEKTARIADAMQKISAGEAENNGDLDEMIDALITAKQAEKLQNAEAEA